MVLKMGGKWPYSCYFVRCCFQEDEQDIWDTAGEVRLNSLTTFSNGSLHTDMQVLDDQQEPLYNSSVWIRDVV